MTHLPEVIEGRTGASSPDARPLRERAGIVVNRHARAIRRAGALVGLAALFGGGLEVIHHATDTSSHHPNKVDTATYDPTLHQATDVHAGQVASVNFAYGDQTFVNTSDAAHHAVVVVAPDANLAHHAGLAVIHPETNQNSANNADASAASPSYPIPLEMGPQHQLPVPSSEAHEPTAMADHAMIEASTLFTQHQIEAMHDILSTKTAAIEQFKSGTPGGFSLSDFYTGANATPTNAKEIDVSGVYAGTVPYITTGPDGNEYTVNALATWVPDPHNVGNVVLFINDPFNGTGISGVTVDHTQYAPTTIINNSLNTYGQSSEYVATSGELTSGEPVLKDGTVHYIPELNPGDKVTLQIIISPKLFGTLQMPEYHVSGDFSSGKPVLGLVDAALGNDVMTQGNQEVALLNWIANGGTPPDTVITNPGIDSLPMHFTGNAPAMSVITPLVRTDILHNPNGQTGDPQDIIK